MSAHNFAFTRRSSNAKTGPLAVTTTDSATCPGSCPLFNECYGKLGPQSLHWRHVDNRTRGNGMPFLVESIRALDPGEYWRHNITGDLPGKGEKINGRELRKITRANHGRRGFTYTHKLPHIGNNARHIRQANIDGFTINLSANSLKQADTYATLNIAPVVVTLVSTQTGNIKTPGGRSVVVCPATQRDDVTCATCKLCARSDRNGIIVGFPMHGTRKRAADIKQLERDRS